jgi:hypothetical protein
LTCVIPAALLNLQSSGDTTLRRETIPCAVLSFVVVTIVALTLQQHRDRSLLPLRATEWGLRKQMYIGLCCVSPTIAMMTTAASSSGASDDADDAGSAAATGCCEEDCGDGDSGGNIRGRNAELTGEAAIYMRNEISPISTSSITAVMTRILNKILNLYHVVRSHVQ